MKPRSQNEAERLAIEEEAAREEAEMLAEEVLAKERIDRMCSKYFRNL